MTFSKLRGARVAVLLLGTALISGKAAADQVIPDDLIVQGSACVGLDCVNNEPFGFDTLRLKENNTRILFLDTSTLAGFPSTDWQLTANDSASGGANKFSIEDITGARVPFTLTAGAPTASLFVDSSGRLGLRTATPLLDVHIATGNTPAHRLEQNASSGFTAQTWDIAGNEANFFVRDLTGGSRLPFRIRPGAPTSSVDIQTNGDVGIGTASPGAFGTGGTPKILQVHNGSNSVALLSLSNTDTASGATPGAIQFTSTNLTGTERRLAALAALKGDASTTSPLGSLLFLTANSAAPTERMRIDNTGNVGIGTTAPAARLHTTGTVRFAGVANCGSGIQSNANGDLSCLVSSRQFKTIAGELPSNVAVANVMALRPQVGSYKETPHIAEHWLIAEDVAAVDPALVGLNDGQPYTVKTQNVVADLVAVVQQQQRRIDELERRLAAK